MNKLIITAVSLLFFALSGTGYGNAGYINPDTGVMELNSGEISLSEIYASEGIIVGPDCTLTVTGDVEAGAFFTSRGGRIYIEGTLRADAVYFDSGEGVLNVELGEVITGYYTQCGGEVKVVGSIAARAGANYDSRGLVSINSENDRFNTTRIVTGGGVFARGGDLMTGGVPEMDEASTSSYYAARGNRLADYGFPRGSGGEPEISAAAGLHATEGGRLRKIA